MFIIWRPKNNLAVMDDYFETFSMYLSTSAFFEGETGADF